MCFWSLQVERDRLHGKADLGHSAVVYSCKRRRIDVDTDDLIFHLKVIVRHTVRDVQTTVHAHTHAQKHLLASSHICSMFTRNRNHKFI